MTKLSHQLILFTLFAFSHFFAVSQEANLLVGTYTQKGSKGIYVYHFDTATGKAVELSHTESVVNPSFLAITKDKQYVYAVNESNEGAISAFNLKRNQLKLINQVTTKGADPCYVTISPDQKNIFVANYSGGSIAQFYRFADGRLSNIRQLIQHQGSSINKERQTSAHVHGTFFSPDGNYLFTPDLGMDKVYIYPFSNTKYPPLQTDKVTIIQSKEGAGPRHLCFSKNNQFIYVMEELSGNISVYQFHKGGTKHVQSIGAHPDSFNKQAGSADIHLSPDGRFLYASNRGEENNIVKLKVLPNGKLDNSSKTYTSTLGNKPRNFTISEDGKWLLVANQDSDSIIIFKINPINGDLIPTGNTIKVSMPVCLVLF
jgi:6-phosphogluconolactonase